MRRFQLRAQVGCMPNEIKEEEKTLLIAVVALLNKSALHADCNTLGTTANRPVLSQLKGAHETINDLPLLNGCGCIIPIARNADELHANCSGSAFNLLLITFF
jgi:hypothetical protein